jgi:hypothetical protein
MTKTNPSRNLSIQEIHQGWQSGSNGRALANVKTRVQTPVPFKKKKKRKEKKIHQ